MIKKKSLLLIAILCFNIFFFIPHAKADVWLSLWPYRLPFTVESDYIDTDLTNFPVLLNVSGIADLFSIVGDDKKHIAVTDSDGNFAYVEIEIWNSDAQIGVLWTSLNLTSSSDETFYLYYGGPENEDYVGVQNSLVGSKVWDDYFMLVDHMQDYNDGSHTVDSTSNDNDGIKKGVDQPLEETGKIGYSQKFTSSNSEMVDCGTGDSLDFTSQAMTVSMWVKGNSGYGAVSPALICRGQWASNGYYIQVNINEKVIFSTSNAQQESGNNALPANNWNYLVVTKTGETAKIYVNNIDVTGAHQAIGDFVTSTRHFYIGTYDNVGGYFDGFIDEIRVSKGENVRSDSWNKASYYSEMDILLTFGSTEIPELDGFTDVESMLFIFGFLGFILSICALALAVNKR